MTSSMEFISIRHVPSSPFAFGFYIFICLVWSGLVLVLHLQSHNMPRNKDVQSICCILLLQLLASNVSGQKYLQPV